MMISLNCNARQSIWASCIVLCITSFTICESSRQHKYKWKLDDMVSDCRPWVSVHVKTGGDLHNITLTQSNTAVFNNEVFIHTARSNFTASHRAPCLYQGTTNSLTVDSVFASELRGQLRLTFRYNGTWYRAVALRNSSEPSIALSFEPHEDILSRCHSKIPPREFSELKLDSSSPNPVKNPVVRRRRSLNLGGFSNAAVTKVLELVIVVDRSFVSKAGSEGNAVARVMQITNYANGAYHKLNLRLVLTNIIIWSADVFPITNSPDSTLNSFTVYKMMQVDVKYDTIILLSAMQWNSGKTLGLAWMNGLCDRLFAAAIVSDKYAESISTAWTLTHEIGHNLGFDHVEDVTGCSCSRTGGCIMNAYLSSTYRLTVLDWSTCAINTWNSQVNSTWRSCLADAPEASYYTSRSPMCGNGILETGEQCDCGPAETCTSRCCDAATCRLKAGAACASGSCCDWNTCSLRSSGDVCRAANGPCDVPETCSGSSEWCPADDKVANGVDCASGQAYCYNGQCKTTDSQCQLLYSATATTGSTTCYNLNRRGDLYGHCSLQLDGVSYVSGAGFDRSYSFGACSLANSECGLLQCYDTAAHTFGGKVSTGGTVCYTPSRMDFSSSDLRSPGFVPDGAKCGSNSMCINSQCTSLSTVRACPTCPNCNSNGVLTRAKLCFCNAGFAPPNCATTGCGGSSTSPLACFDSNRTTISQPTTSTLLTTTPSNQNGTVVNPDTIFGLQMWQIIAILVGAGVLILLVIISVSAHCAIRNQRLRRAKRAARPAPPSQHPPPSRQQSQHPPPSRQQLQHPPPSRQQSRPQQPLPQPPPRPDFLRPSPHQAHNPAFVLDDFTAPPPPYESARPQPSAPPPPPSFRTAAPSMYTLSSPQAWSERPPPRYF
ncbi:hypothetical protein BOX15_Mlig004569g1 [Macrostomum lignano]|uniref:Disintegrin domain-containing protein n=1 Tax=Macrostomum lignano TaxID=282301 RepID=A0A267F0Q9_9PLAT|nr:hypothetical protein BOX15_Mlig004569g1 [Macrostomum lignano]